MKLYVESELCGDKGLFSGLMRFNHPLRDGPFRQFYSQTNFDRG